MRQIGGMSERKVAGGSRDSRLHGNDIGGGVASREEMFSGLRDCHVASLLFKDRKSRARCRALCLKRLPRSLRLPRNDSAGDVHAQVTRVGGPGLAMTTVG